MKNKTGAIETHFRLIDYIKDLIYNSTNDDQEKQARHLLELAKEQEKYLEV